MDRPEGDIWNFGYGSLMWRPNFPFTEAAPALLRGNHRSLCIYSTEYRGTWERPGLVLGLDRGGSCRGQAMKVADKDADEVIAYLHERELVNRVYVASGCQWCCRRAGSGPMPSSPTAATRNSSAAFPRPKSLS